MDYLDDELEDEFSTNSGARDSTNPTGGNAGQYGSLVDPDFSSTSNDENDPLVAGLVKTYEQSWSYQVEADAESENDRPNNSFFRFPVRTAMLVGGIVLAVLAVVYTNGGNSKTGGQDVYSDVNIPPLPAVPPNPPDTKQVDNPPIIPSDETPPPPADVIPAVVVVVEPIVENTDPTHRPTPAPTSEPTWPPEPTKAPTEQPTHHPDPTLEPTAQPTAPTQQPTKMPLPAPTFMPTPTLAGKHKTRAPVPEPSAEPTIPHPTLPPTQQPTRTPPPNIIFVLADDLGYHSLSTDLTPFLMSMRANGVILGKYYSQEVCTPTRASFLTGRYPISLGWQKNEASAFETGGLGLEETTLAEVLKTNGYSTFMFGKWNLGSSSPRYLPTARGFDYFMGYLDGFTNYWSKTDPTAPTYKDLLYSTTQCYYSYDWMDMTTYSTFLYRDKALEAIEKHDFKASSMFMYLAFQAVHDPFADSDVTFGSGVPKDYLDDARYSYILKNVEGQINQEYFKSLALMDSAIESVYYGLDSRGVLDNTYIVFASDNGGCPASGGKNTPLRGAKGSLFEGGLKVDAFIHSRMLESKVVGTVYGNLFHVSDWFPTLLDMTKSADHVANTGYELDGVSHWNQLRGLSTVSPRPYVLYNYYYNPGKGAMDSNDFFKGAPGAIRDSRYKLMHTYDSTSAGTWFKASQSNPYGDDNLNEKGGCTQAAAAEGTYTYFLFDLDVDPNETTNLYDASVTYTEIQQTLYKQIIAMTAGDKVKTIKTSKRATGVYEATWEANANYITPWEAAEDAATLPGTRAFSQYPASCGMYSTAIATQRLTPFEAVSVAATTGAPPVVASGPAGLVSGPGTGVVVSGTLPTGVVVSSGATVTATTGPVATVTATTGPVATVATGSTVAATPAATTVATGSTVAATPAATTTTTTTTTTTGGKSGPAPWDQR